MAIKTHQTDAYHYTHAVHLVRSPFDALESLYEWKKSLGWDWKYGELTWEDFVNMFARKWQEHTRHWLQAPCATYRIRYEDCRRDPLTNFSSLLRWMGLGVSEDMLRKTIEETSFKNLKRAQVAKAPIAELFFRRGQVNGGLARFSSEQTRWMVDLLRPELLACGYANLIDVVRRESTMNRQTESDSIEADAAAEAAEPRI